MVAAPLLAASKRWWNFVPFAVIVWLLVACDGGGGCGGGGGAGCGSVGTPPQFGALFIGIFDPMIGADVPCYEVGTTTPCPPPPVAFAGHTSATGGYNTCFIAKEFGASLPPGFPPAGFPACSSNNSVQVTVSWQWSGTASGWQINTVAGSLQPGTWSVAWQTPLLNGNRPLACSVTIPAGSDTSLNSCP